MKSVKVAPDQVNGVQPDATCRTKNRYVLDPIVRLCCFRTLSPWSVCPP